MGAGASNNQGRRHSVIEQLPTIDPLRQPHLSRAPHQNHSPSPHSSSPPPQVKQTYKPGKRQSEWPLPPTRFEDEFQPNWSTDTDRYSVKKRAYHTKFHESNKKFKLLEATQEDREFHQKETSSIHWKKDNSSINDSAHVQSSLKTQSHSCINLSTTEEIDRLLRSLTEIHSQIDLNIGQRQRNVSVEAKVIIDLIVNDTRQVQQNLLAFAKQRQTIQDQLYNEWLQMYVVQLDAWKSTRLAELQEELQKHQTIIMSRSQQLIAMVNADANRLRDDILAEEQTTASSLVREITDKIQTMSTHHLGTETMTKINLTIHGNVGTKAPGQGCTFDFGHNGGNDDKQNDTRKGYSSKVISSKSQPPSGIKIIKQSSVVIKKQGHTKSTTIGEEEDDNDNENDDDQM